MSTEITRRSLLRALAAGGLSATWGNPLSARPARASQKDASSPLRRELDARGRAWYLEDWSDRSRPYRKSLREREQAYLSRWGEPWAGREFRHYVLSPGDWRWEVLATLPEPLASVLFVTKNDPKPHHHERWSRIWPSAHVYAPGAREPTELYAATETGYVHLDLATRAITFIGSPTERGLTDGTATTGRIRNAYGMNQTMDLVSGRLYFRQTVGQSRFVLRGVDKLLPYRDTGTGARYLLPAFLDFDRLHAEIKSPDGGALEPADTGGRRAGPTFVVRTFRQAGNITMPGPNRGLRLLLTPDGRGLYVSLDGWDGWYTSWTKLGYCDVETGNRRAISLDESQLPPPARGKPNGMGSHGAVCVGVDGVIYVAEHGGAGRHPMRLFSLDPGTSASAILYDSSPYFGQLAALTGGAARGAVPFWDGPADAQTLAGTSTMAQIQCPRTGAIYNGGWDKSGVRRYQDGFVTTLFHSEWTPSRVEARRPEPWAGDATPKFWHHNTEIAVGPSGDIYIADVYEFPQRLLRLYRTDWPREQPEYGYGARVLPRARLRELMLDHARKYVANYAALTPRDDG
jgi:hypothetical protein